MELSRRSLIRGAGVLLVAPAIVRVASLMPVRSPKVWLTPVRVKIVHNGVVREWLNIQAIRDQNVMLRTTVYAGEPVVSFRGIPIRVVG